MAVTALLSQCSLIGGPINARPISFRSDLIHSNSLTSRAIALYSALALDKATTSCFLLHQVSRLPPS